MASAARSRLMPTVTCWPFRAAGAIAGFTLRDRHAALREGGDYTLGEGRGGCLACGRRRVVEEGAGVLTEARHARQRVLGAGKGPIAVLRRGQTIGPNQTQIAVRDTQRCAQIVNQQREHPFRVRHPRRLARRL